MSIGIDAIVRDRSVFFCGPLALKVLKVVFLVRLVFALSDDSVFAAEETMMMQLRREYLSAVFVDYPYHRCLSCFIERCCYQNT